MESKGDHRELREHTEDSEHFQIDSVEKRIR